MALNNQIMKTLNTGLIRNSLFIIAISFAAGCQKNNNGFDASGTFETDEIIVSSEISGKILAFDKNEGDLIKQDDIVVHIDPTTLALQKASLEASLASIPQKANSAKPQIAVIEQQILTQQNQTQAMEVQMVQLQREKARTERLLLAEAATQKQLDDLNSQVEVLQKQISSSKQQETVLQSQIQMQKDVVSIQNRGLFSEQDPINKQIEQIDDQIKRAQVTSPIGGVILTKYMNAGEFATPGKALFKLADIENMILRAYITGDQLSETRLGQKVDVFVDQGADEYRQLEGVITWISSEAEFTPKTIQTKDERADLVYAVKVHVKNDGYLKIGMYGEIKLNTES